MAKIKFLAYMILAGRVLLTDIPEKYRTDVQDFINEINSK